MDNFRVSKVAAPRITLFLSHASDCTIIIIHTCPDAHTQQYPQENSFGSFLANNGGSSNAYTDSENTVYYFDMEAETANRFTEGLLRFGSFFTAPLLTASATGRELNAIESENKKNLQSDAFRVFQLAKARANQDHPFSKFFTGNKKTLLEDTTAAGIDLRAELVKFYTSYYSANQMTLAIVAPQSLDDLEEMARKAFGDIPNRQADKPEKKWQGISPYLNGNSLIPSFGYVAEVVPVQDLRQLNIAWPIVYTSEEDRQNALLYKTSNYVAHLIGHEGPRSLLSRLKRKGWANSVSVASEEELSDFETFDVVVGLTTRGLGAVNEVVEFIYSYLRLMKDQRIPAYIFNEVLQLDELQWRFLTKGSPKNYATSLATSMQRFPPEYYVAGPRRIALDGYYDDPNEPMVVGSQPRSSFASKEQLDRTMAEVDDFLTQLSVDNSIVTVISKGFEGQTDRKEKWYGTDYRVRPLPDVTLAAWKKPVDPKKLKLDFPKPNIFIPSESGLVARIPAPPKDVAASRTFESRMEPVRSPRVIRDDGPDGKWKVYYKEDDRFGLPKGYIVFQILSPEVFASSKKAALTNLLEICIEDKLSEYAYDAGLAGLIYEVKVVPRGIRLTFGGYSDKLQDFAAYVSKKLSVEVTKLLPKTDQEFDRYKDQIMRALSAFDVKQPYFHASYYSQLTLQPPKFQFVNSEMRDQTRSLLLPDLLAYASDLWSRGKGEALIQGNFDEKQALSLVKTIGDALPFKALPDIEVPALLEALPLPTSDGEIVPTRMLIAEPNPENENSVSYVMLQSLDKSEKSHVLMELIAAIVDEPFYSELRTTKQLGYIVSSGIRGVAGTRTLSFIVQSNVAASAVLSVEIIKFLDSVEEKLLKKLSDIDLQIYAKSLIDRKTEPDKDLSIEVQRNWAEISTGRFQFNRLQSEAAALLLIEKADLLDFWRSLYSSDGRRMLITEIIPRQGEVSSPLPPTSTGYAKGDQGTSGLLLGIDDIIQFRRDRDLA
jgi:insulysin